MSRFFSLLSRFLLFFLLLPGLAATTSGAPASLSAPVLVADFSPGTQEQWIDPQSIAVIDGLLYFSARDFESGEEPWVSDGSAAGTRRLADLCPGSCSSSPRNFIPLGDKILFSSFESRALYALDAEGITEIADELPFPSYFFALGDKLYFSSGSSGRTRQMYHTDGTAEGTVITTDFCRDAPCAMPSNVTLLQGSLYFSLGDSSYRLAADGQLHLLATGVVSTSFTALGDDKVVFYGCKSVVCSAWISDGSAAGTFSLEPFPEIGLTVGANQMVAWRGRVYFGNYHGQMVSTDGTVAGTQYEPSFQGIRPSPLAATTNKLFYTDSGILDPGPVQLRARSPNGSEVLLRESTGSVRLEAEFGDRVVFAYSNNSEGPLAISDGTPEGTFEVADVYSLSPGAVLNGIYYFGFDPGGSPLGATLWRTDGTAAGTYALDVNPTVANSTGLYSQRLGSTLIAQIGSANGEYDDLYRIHPQTLEVRPFLPDQVLRLTEHHSGQLAYALNPSQDELWALTEPGATRVFEDRLAESAMATDGRLYFTDLLPGQKLWASDGTSDGTRELFDLLPGYVPQCSGHHCEPNYPEWITPSGSRVFFVAADAEPFTEAIWVLEPGASTPKRVAPWNFGRTLESLHDGRVFFTAATADQPHPPAYWVSDGTPQGTYVFFSEPTGSYLRAWAFAGGKLFFELSDGNNTQSTLWVSDLSPGGSRPLHSTPYIEINELVAAGNKVFFTGKFAVGRGHELGFSDGTPEGTGLIDLRQAPLGSRASHLFALDDGRIVFGAAGDDGAGKELWISDGTYPGTQRLTDLAPGELSSDPTGFAQVGQKLFFQATDGEVGRELWRLELPAATDSCPEDRVCLHFGRFVAKVAGQTATGPFVGHRELANSSSGLFSFFSPGNWELMVKVLDGCAINGKYWLFGAAATDVGWTLTVDDLQTGARKTYSNPSGQPAKAITDIGAFACN